MSGTQGRFQKSTARPPEVYVQPVKNTKIRPRKTVADKLSPLDYSSCTTPAIGTVVLSLMRTYTIQQLALERGMIYSVLAKCETLRSSVQCPYSSANERRPHSPRVCLGLSSSPPSTVSASPPPFRSS